MDPKTSTRREERMPLRFRPIYGLVFGVVHGMVNKEDLAPFTESSTA